MHTKLEAKNHEQSCIIREQNYFILNVRVTQDFQ